jgi:hypothetical protein
MATAPDFRFVEQLDRLALIKNQSSWVTVVLSLNATQLASQKQKHISSSKPPPANHP